LPLSSSPILSRDETLSHRASRCLFRQDIDPSTHFFPLPFHPLRALERRSFLLQTTSPRQDLRQSYYQFTMPAHLAEQKPLRDHVITVQCNRKSPNAVSSQMTEIMAHAHEQSISGTQTPFERQQTRSSIDVRSVVPSCEVRASCQGSRASVTAAAHTQGHHYFVNPVYSLPLHRPAVPARSHGSTDAGLPMPSRASSKAQRISVQRYRRTSSRVQRLKQMPATPKRQPGRDRRITLH
jgi:hypothetical protein